MEDYGETEKPEIKAKLHIYPDDLDPDVFYEEPDFDFNCVDCQIDHEIN